LFQSLPKAKTPRDRNGDSTDEESDQESEEEEKEETEGGAVRDEDDWERFQEESKRENALEAKSKESHLVHCPYFPMVRPSLLFCIANQILI
jgi:translocation protein SEC63